ncbi:MAG: hypothetical protein ACI8P0_006662, partial [Planctomycetaceae bacterium]
MSRHSVLLIVGFVAVLAVASVRGADELPNQYEAGDIKV